MACIRNFPLLHPVYEPRNILSQLRLVAVLWPSELFWRKSWRWEEQRESRETEPDIWCNCHWLCSYLYTSHNQRIIWQCSHYLSQFDFSVTWDKRKANWYILRNNEKSLKRECLVVLDISEKGIYNFGKYQCV